MNVVTQFPAARDYERERRFQAVFEEAAIGIGICQFDGRILEANPALSRMLGYSQQELAGSQAGDFFPEVHPELHRENGRESDPGNFSQDE
jgi:PAS domain S-box-containing protein